MVANSLISPIETSRLLLRAAEERDAEPLAAMMTEAVSRRLASWPVPYTPLMAEDRILGTRAAAAEQRSVPMIIERRSDGAVCGWLSISRSPDDARTALITYWLGEAYQRQGLMREAAPAAVAEAFGRLDVDRIRAAVQADNAASIAVTRLLGMTALGEGRIWCPARGREESCLWYELPRPLEKPFLAGLPAAEPAVPA